MQLLEDVSDYLLGLCPLPLDAAGDCHPLDTCHSSPVKNPPKALPLCE